MSEMVEITVEIEGTDVITYKCTKTISVPAHLLTEDGQIIADDVSIVAIVEADLDFDDNSWHASDSQSEITGIQIASDD